MMEDDQPDREQPEEKKEPAANVGAPKQTGKAAVLPQTEDEPSGRFLEFVFTASMLSLAFLRRLIRKPKAKERRTRALAPAPPYEEGQRTEDGTLERQSDADLDRRRKRGTPLVVLAFLVGMAGGVGFIFLYWTGGGNRLLGLTLALCLAGFGAVLVLYSHWMIRHELVIAPREEIPSSRDEREEAFEDYAVGASDVQRRDLLKWMIAGATGLFAAMGVSMVRSLARTAPEDFLFSTIWKRGQRLVTMGGKILTVDSLEPGSSMTVFPENSAGSEHAQTVLIRVDPHLLRLPQGRTDWAPMGYIAYSRVCTHAGCAVGMFEAHSNLLLCPCHQSTFDVLRGAVPTGGPAARPLPQLPLYVDKAGNLCAQGGFTSPPGPGFMGMPS